MTHNPFGRLPVQDFIAIGDLQADELKRLLATAIEIKANRAAYKDLLAGKRIAMLFEKESLRTRVTFDIGIQELGGSAVFLDLRDQRMGSRESVRDMAKNLERWVDGIIARTFRHRTVMDLAKNASIPVINGLTDLLHPCQALADTLTLTERWGSVEGRKIVFVGDGNNTCHSLMMACAKLGADFLAVSPEGYEPNLKVMNQALAAAKLSGATIDYTDEIEDSVRGADAIYTDVWASMGQEDEVEERSGVFADYQVDDEMMALAKPDAVFMHCLPAHRGQEVTASVMDGPQSIVFDIAENRLHAQKAVMAMLMGAGESAQRTPAFDLDAVEVQA
ncbi:MAG: ornithine carbamoyltransferase [Planctomycetota bacterium]